MKQLLIALLFVVYLATIPLALSALTGCEAKVTIEGESVPEPEPPKPKAAITVKTEQTIDSVNVEIVIANENGFNSYVNLEGRNEIDHFKEQAQFLVDKLEEAQNQWEKMAPLSVEGNQNE
jgi:hypothetical protein